MIEVTITEMMLLVGWVEDCSISYGHEYLIPVKDVTEENANENK